MNQFTLRKLASNPAEFRESLIIPSASGPVRFGDCIADFQAKDFSALDGSFISLQNGKKPELNRFWIERVKGGSKTSDIATLMLWLLAFCPRTLLIQVAAKDGDQADEIRKAMRDILRSNNWLSQRIEVQRNAVINRATESRLDILTVDERGAHGSRPHVLFIDEVVHIENRDFVETLLDNAAKTSALTNIATNAGFVPSWQFDLREMARQSDRWYFSQVTQPAPWISEADIEERRLSTSQNRFNRLWRGLWVSDHGDALQPPDIEAAITLTGPMNPDDPGAKHYRFVAGIDIGLRKHATTFVVVGWHVGGMKVVESDSEGIFDGWNMVPKKEYQRTEGTYRYRLAKVEVWRPQPGNRVSLEAVRSAILNAHQQFKLSAVCIDPYQGEHLAELLRHDRVPVQLVPQTGPSLSTQATTLIEAFQQRLIDLYPHDHLLADIGALQLQEKSYGVRLVSPRYSQEGSGTAHGDTTSALSIALNAVRDLSPMTGDYGLYD